MMAPRVFGNFVLNNIAQIAAAIERIKRVGGPAFWSELWDDDGGNAVAGEVCWALWKKMDEGDR